ncbi:MAG: hypothetical protein IJL89_03255 [Firmicutes bacterium]|nr:hypothetical protein [Bacillota bacterium]
MDVAGVLHGKISAFFRLFYGYRVILRNSCRSKKIVSVVNADFYVRIPGISDQQRLTVLRVISAVIGDISFLYYCFS